MYELINRFFYFSDHKIISVSDHTLLISDLNNIKMGSTIFQKQSPSGVLRRRCSENMQHIYRRTPMSKFLQCHISKTVIIFRRFRYTVAFKVPGDAKTQ